MIVISGVSSGLGRALAEGFREQGEVVVGCARRAEALESLARSAGGIYAVVDVANDDQVAAWAEEILAKHGPPRLLINNAAIINRNANLWELEASEVDAILRINLGGTATLIRHFVPAMIEAKGGVIVNFSSGWGRSTAPQVATYCATKFGIEGLTSALAEELPEGLAAVAVNPGIIDTPMLRSTWAEAASTFDDPAAWASRAVPFLQSLGPQHNGRSLDVPG